MGSGVPCSSPASPTAVKHHCDRRPPATRALRGTFSPLELIFRLILIKESVRSLCQTEDMNTTPDRIICWYLPLPEAPVVPTVDPGMVSSKILITHGKIHALCGGFGGAATGFVKRARSWGQFPQRDAVEILCRMEAGHAAAANDNDQARLIGWGAK